MNELCNHALETASGPHPEECCGLVSGTPDDRYARVHRCRNEMNRLHRQDPHGYPRDAKDAFWMNEGDVQAVFLAAEQRGLRVTGVYHSHVGAAAYFSETDQEYAARPEFPFPDVEHLVISVVEGLLPYAGAAFRWNDAVGAFEGRAVELVAP